MTNELSVKERCEVLAEYMLLRSCTVRACAAHFGVSKSTVHKDVTAVLENVNPPLYFRVSALLAKNKNERHLRGGEATRKKYAMERHGSRNNKV